jgi:predicted O-linked N-acetylglucosamine transferase (SPINDLY family)
MAACGIALNRFELLGRIPIDAYFAGYRDVDVALDSYPYNGATTTCDALLMGVPVATIAGGRAISRGGVSLMTTVGLPEWVASSPDGLVDLLKTQTANVGAMAALRTGLPQRMRASALMDGTRFARSLEDIFRRAWRDACP